MTHPTTVVYVGTSLDGFIARPDGGLDWLGTPPEGEDYGWAEFLASVDAIVMGRATFEVVLSFGAWPYGEMPVTVLSRTLDSLPEDLPDTVELSALEPREVMEVMEGRGHRRIYVDGGGVVRSFLREDRIDELVLTTVPVLIGRGLPLFGPLDADLAWDHVGTETLTGGLVKSRYRRRR